MIGVLKMKTSSVPGRGAAYVPSGVPMSGSHPPGCGQDVGVWLAVGVNVEVGLGVKVLVGLGV